MRLSAFVATLMVTLVALTAPSPALASNETNLYKSAIEGDAKSVAKYLKQGADPNYRSDDHYTPLLVAAMHGHAEVCRILIDAGADYSTNADGWTALHLAADDGHTEVVAVLLEAGASVDVKLGGDYTALDLAVNGGHKGVVDLLTAAGSGTSATGKTLFIAADAGDLETVEALVNNGASMQWQRPSNHQTPLHAAAFEGHVEVVRFLLSKGADFEAEEVSGLTPLLLAAQEGKTEVVRLLLDAGASIHHKDDYQMTAIHRSAQSGNKETLLLLLERGAKLDEGAADNTPLFIAAGEGDLELCRILIDKGADVNYRMDSGAFTALHRSAAAGSYEVTELLLSHGANPNITNRLGKTPLQLAIDGGHEKVAELLRKNGATK